MTTSRVSLVLTALAGAALAHAAGASGGARAGGHLVYPEREGQGAVVFSHRSHGKGGAGYRCSTCHPQMRRQQGHVTMRRVNEGKDCGACHDGRTKAPATGRVAFAASECTGCHQPPGELRIGLKHMGDVVFRHSTHTRRAQSKAGQAAGLSCGDCHPALFAKDAGALFSMMMPHDSGGCAACHDGKRHTPPGRVAFSALANCRKCHLPGIQGSKS